MGSIIGKIVGQAVTVLGFDGSAFRPLSVDASGAVNVVGGGGGSSLPSMASVAGVYRGGGTLMWDSGWGTWEGSAVATGKLLVVDRVGVYGLPDDVEQVVVEVYDPYDPWPVLEWRGSAGTRQVWYDGAAFVMRETEYLSVVCKSVTGGAGAVAIVGHYC